MSLVNSILNSAKSYVGTQEGSAAHQDIIDLYNRGRYSDAYCMTMNDPWCCAFVVAMFVENGAADIIPGYAYCDGMIQVFKQWGRWKPRDSTVNKGDIIFYDWNGDGSSDHVGIVDQNQFGTLKVIEGNKSDSVSYRSISKNDSAIMGYGVPNYDGSDGGTFQSTKPTEHDDAYIKTLPLLQEGSKNVYVKILQVFLNYYAKENLDIDGDFGPATKKAVIAYQTKNNLEVDGIVGKETWGYLLLKEK